MPVSAIVADTPCYVLMKGGSRLSPNVVPLSSGRDCSAVYGFSGKDSYGKFCSLSEQALTPYPLVKTFLRDQVASSGDSLRLVILDASGPKDPCVLAATMESVLEVLESRTTEVTVAHRLKFDFKTDVYEIEEVSV